MPNNDTSTIRPGILVALSTTLHGGVRYDRRDISKTDKQEQWETTKFVDDPAELEAASKCRSKARGLIAAACATTSFGLLCPEANEVELNSAIDIARALAEDHNRTAKFTRVAIYVLKGRVASTDEEAARAIASDVEALIREMNAGIGALDAKRIREAADKAKQMGRLLSDEKAEKIGAAVEAARKAARVIVKRVEKGSEEAAVVLADIKAAGLASAVEASRMAFLDLDEAPDSAPADSAPAVQVQRMAFLDLGDEETPPPQTVINYTGSGATLAGIDAATSAAEG